MRYNLFMRHQQHFQNYPVLYFVTGCLLYLFFLFCIYSETQNDVNKMGGGAEARKLFRNYYHTPMTAEIKLKNHNVESLKFQKKFLGLLLDT